MRHLIIAICTLASFSAVGQSGKSKSYGAKVTPKDAVEVNILEAKLTADPTFTGKVKGTIKTVCQAEGCWIKLEQTDGSGIMVRFKDHKFFVPKDIAGKDVVVDGTAKMTTTSVEMLKHYAEDAGKSKEDIDKITEPKKEIEFIAKGVLVYN
jgi:hypothetical protein